MSVEALVAAQEIFLPFSAESIAVAKAYRARLGVEPSDEEAALVFCRSTPSVPQISAAGLRAFFEAKRRICPWLRLLDPQKIPSAFSSRASTPVNQSTVNQTRRSTPISLESASRLFKPGNISAPHNSDLEVAMEGVVLWEESARNGNDEMTLEGMNQAWTARFPDQGNHAEFFQRYVVGEWFDLKGAFSRRFGYRTNDPARLFDFWKFLRAENSLEPGMRGFSKTQVLKFIEDDDEEEEPVAKPEEPKRSATPRKPERPVPRPRTPPRDLRRLESLSRPRQRTQRTRNFFDASAALALSIKKFWKEISADFPIESDEFFDALFCVCLAQLSEDQVDAVAAEYSATGKDLSEPFENVRFDKADGDYGSVLYSIMMPSEKMVLAAMELRISCSSPHLQDFFLALTDHKGRPTFSAEFDLPAGRISTVLLEFSAVLKGRAFMEFSGGLGELLGLRMSRASGPLAHEKFRVLVKRVLEGEERKKETVQRIQQVRRKFLLRAAPAPAPAAVPPPQARVRAQPRPVALRPLDIARQLRGKIARARAERKIPEKLGEEISRLPGNFSEPLLLDLRVLSKELRPARRSSVRRTEAASPAAPKTAPIVTVSETIEPPRPNPSPHPAPAPAAPVTNHKAVPSFEPGIYKKRMCLELLETGICSNKENCAFAHSAADRASADPFDAAPAPRPNPRPRSAYQAEAYE